MYVGMILSMHTIFWYFSITVIVVMACTITILQAPRPLNTCEGSTNTVRHMLEQ